MCSKPENTNQLQPASQGMPSSTVCSQPWWHGVGYNSAPPGILGENASKSSVEPTDDDSETKSSKSQGDGSSDTESISKEMQISIEQQSGADGNYGPENHLQHASTMPPTGGEYFPHPQLELVGHSVACAPYPYSDPYYGGLMTAYGTQPLVNPHLLGMHHTRMALPLQMTEEPVYVNAKQYHGIIRRRESRAKAELERKLIKVRKPYLHESRHQHALRRARGCGGRFLNTKKVQKDGTNATSEKGMDSGATGSSGSGSGTNASTMDPSDCRQENGFSRQEEVHESRSHASGDGKNNGSYQNHHGFRVPTYHERGDDGDCSVQQRGSISVSQARHRALAIQ